MIKITDEMRNASRRELHELENRTDREITRAAERGENKAVFPLDDTDPRFSELKTLYERNGYKIVPVGIIGGVRQRDYFIMW